jgi:hypothetical protein
MRGSTDRAGHGGRTFTIARARPSALSAAVRPLRTGGIRAFTERFARTVGVGIAIRREIAVRVAGARRQAVARSRAVGPPVRRLEGWDCVGCLHSGSPLLDPAVRARARVADLLPGCRAPGSRGQAGSLRRRRTGALVSPRLGFGGPIHACGQRQSSGERTTRNRIIA